MAARCSEEMNFSMRSISFRMNGLERSPVKSICRGREPPNSLWRSASVTRTGFCGSRKFVNSDSRLMNGMPGIPATRITRAAIMMSLRRRITTRAHPAMRRGMSRPAAAGCRVRTWMQARRAGTNMIEMRRENRTPTEAKIPKSLIVVRYDPMMNDENPRTIVRAASTTRIPTSRNAAWDSSAVAAVPAHVFIELAENVDAGGSADGDQERGDDVGNQGQGDFQESHEPDHPYRAHEHGAQGNEHAAYRAERKEKREDDQDGYDGDEDLQVVHDHGGELGREHRVAPEVQLCIHAGRGGRLRKAIDQEPLARPDLVWQMISVVRPSAETRLPRYL